MPNYITNELTADTEIIDSLNGENGKVDFNTVIPMPEILLSSESSSTVTEGLAIIGRRDVIPDRFVSLEEMLRYPWVIAAEIADTEELKAALLKRTPDCIQKAQAAIKAFEECGYANWYEWSREKWGTKWNAGDINRTDFRKVKFTTAWSAPLPVIVGLSKKFAAATIRLRWADEDFGCNVGDVTFLGGNLVEGDRLENDSIAAHQLALELIYNGECPEDHKIENGKLVYIEEGASA